MWLKKVCEQLDSGTADLAKISGYLKRFAGKCWVPPGHFYSPIVDPDDIAGKRERIFDRSRAVSGVDFNADAQQALLVDLAKYYAQLGYTFDATPERRYYFNNGYFSHLDAVLLACMILHCKPRRIIESGSGFTSAIMADMNALFLDHRIELTFIDPHPERIYQLLREDDLRQVTVINSPVQDVAPALFDELEAGDFFFADTTHVSKCGSDVNHIVFEILPRLRPGVLVHFHDIFYPFEYPEAWVLQIRRSWNELYLLRAFLTANTDYAMLLFINFLEHHCPELLREHFAAFHDLCQGRPLSLHGGSLWLRKR